MTVRRGCSGCDCICTGCCANWGDGCDYVEGVVPNEGVFGDM